MGLRVESSGVQGKQAMRHVDVEPVSFSSEISQGLHSLRVSVLLLWWRLPLLILSRDGNRAIELS